MARLFRSRRGNIAATTALMMPVFIGMAGLASDTIQWTFVKRAMQRHADSAAIAGALALSQNSDYSRAVTRDLQLNGGYTLTATPVVQNPPTAGPNRADPMAVRVALATQLRLPFVGLLMSDAATVRSEATAAIISRGSYCALALEPTTTVGVSVGGNASLDLRCGIATNSLNSNAVDVGGSSGVQATPITAQGGLLPSRNYIGATRLIPYAIPQKDPFASVPMPTPAPGNNAINVGSNQSRNFSPGTYSSINIQGTVNLAPGTYVVTGSISFGAQARVTGTGVTLVMTSRTPSVSSSFGQLDINGGAVVNLTAPTSGTYRGLLIYQDRRAPNQSGNRINGNSGSRIEGAIYMPSQELQFNGTSGMNVHCMQLIARRLNFRGNTTITNNCTVGSGGSMVEGTQVRLTA